MSDRKEYLPAGRNKDKDKMRPINAKFQVGGGERSDKYWSKFVIHKGRPRYEKVLGSFGDITQAVKEIEKDLKPGNGFELVKTDLGEVVVFTSKKMT